MLSDKFLILPYGLFYLVQFLDYSLDLAGVSKLLRNNGLTARVGLGSIVVGGVDDESHCFSAINEALELISNKASYTKDNVERVETVTVDYTNNLDLTEVAQLLSVSAEEVVKRHSSTLWKVDLIGFAPGFPYLSPTVGKEFWAQLGRLENPRPKVPKGSVGLAAGLSCIYPAEMPGGWRVLGVSEVQLFNIYSDKPSLLSAGDFVKFEAKNA